MTDSPGTAIERREQIKPVVVPSDDEIRRQWRIAEALAQAQLFDGGDSAKVNTAEAFAKILVGHDLGLSATQALMGVHIVKGKPQLSANVLASFVKRTPGYDYEITTHTYDDSKKPPEGECTIAFFVDDEPVGTSTFTMDDARRQKLVKSGSAWETVPLNMLFARALSNGVRWYMPDATGGVAVYVPGELQASDAPALTAGTGSGEAQGLDLGPKVEKVLARAAELGHEAIADRATAEIALGKRSPEAAVKWVAEKTAELDAFEAEQENVTDADVVEDKSPVEPGSDAERAAAARAVAETLDKDAEAAFNDGEEDKANELLAAAAQMREQAEALEVGDDVPETDEGRDSMEGKG